MFSPVARYSSIRTLLALANAQNLEVHQMDVKTAFLNGSIEHDIYMSQPEGFIDPDHPEYVCKLKKSIYGLKQSARCWNQTLDSFLIGNGYRKSGADNCIYVKSKTNADGFISFVILAIYVDDIIPVSNSELYIYGRLTSVNYVIKKCNTKWRKLKALLGVIFGPLTCKYFCKFLFCFFWRKVFRNGLFPF